MATTTERDQGARCNYGRVRLDQLDPKAQVLMRRLTRESTEFGGAIAKSPHGIQLAALAEGIADEFINGTARAGLALDRLCKGRTSPGRIRERFAIEKLEDLVELGTRGLLLRDGFKVVHEHLTSVPVRPGKDMHGFAIDQLPRRARMGHVLLSSACSDDRTLVTQALWLPTGTQDDRSSERADRDRIKGWSNDLGFDLPGSLSENLERLFKAQKRARDAAYAAAKRGSPAFDAFKIDARIFLEYCFPRCVILDLLAYGPPSRSGASSATVVFPGDEENLIEVVQRAGRYGIARCRIDDKVELDEVEKSLLPELRDRFGEDPVPVPPEILEQVAQWETARNLAIGESVRFIRFWYFRRAGYVLRAAQLPGGEVYDVHLWRAVGLDGTYLKEIITLIERARQAWPESCVVRYPEECAPGKMSPWKARKREGLLKTTLLPNAAGVTAHRAMERRLAAERSQRPEVRKQPD